MSAEVYDMASRRLTDVEQSISQFDGGSGGGDNPHMEARVSALEKKLGAIDERLIRVEGKIDHIEKEVSQTKWWIVAQIAAGFIAVLGTGIAIQQMTVATFQAAGGERSAQPPAQPVQPIVIQLPAQQQAPKPRPETPGK